MGNNLCNCPNPCVNKEERGDKNLSRKMTNEEYSSEPKNNNLTLYKILLNNSDNKNILNQQNLIMNKNFVPNLKYEISKPSIIENRNMTQIIENAGNIYDNENLNNSYFSNKVKSKKTNYEKSHIPKINKGQSLDKLIKNNSSTLHNQKNNINKTPNKYINRNQGNKKIKHRNKLSSLSTKSNTKNSTSMQFHL